MALSSHPFRRLRRPAVVLAAAAVALGTPSALAAVPSAGAAPDARAAAGAARDAARDYVVVLDTDPASSSSRVVDTALRTVETAVDALGADVTGTYDSVLTGLAVTLDPAAVAAVRSLPGVDLVVPDEVVTLDDVASDAAAKPVVQRRAPWGLDRIDQRSNDLDNRFRAKSRGAGVNAYVVDTGIRRTHREFRGRVKQGFSALGGAPTDCNGHGTHVSGIVGGRTYGVAKKVTLVPVKVLNCRGSGRISGIVRGLDWVSRHAPRDSVVNMSLGGARNRALNRAVKNLVKRGTSVVVAAGNNSRDACGFSPGSTKSAITVGASGRNDGRAFFSNTGSCVDLDAPGVGIRSAWKKNDRSTRVLDGTSMASPYVAGVVALYLQKHPAASPAQVASLVRTKATDVSGLLGGRRILYSHLPGA